MKSTGKWVQAVDKDNISLGVRMLHEDRRGRLCVRYGRQWWLVAEKRMLTGDVYQTTRMA